MINWYKKYSKIVIAGTTPLSDEEMREMREIVGNYWKPVDSSFITHIGYEESMQILEVKLKSGNQYRYNNVPKDIYDEFMDSSSKGQFFNDVIKNRFKTIKKD